MTGEELRAYRQELGMNQTDFAAHIGVSRKATVSDYEKGKREVPDTLALLIECKRDFAAFKKKIENIL
jgi:DNA-binding XRE family transcriptional regulator